MSGPFRLTTHASFDESDPAAPSKVNIELVCSLSANIPSGNVDIDGVVLGDLDDPEVWKRVRVDQAALVATTSSDRPARYPVSSVGLIRAASTVTTPPLTTADPLTFQ